MSYLLLKFIHLTAAAFFIGGVFFEVMILSRVTRQLEQAPREQLSKALGLRARSVMRWVIPVLYGAGLGLAWQYRAVLHNPLGSSLGTMMALKIGLALSILVQFIGVVYLMRTGRMTASRSRRLHLSVLLHMLGILFLAKAMFLLNV
ncbi:hypothetical protein CYD26_00895 [Pseudomonas sp. FFUP_PS_473]|uniref:CopD family copper resistance protein n=1 Tax=unclassified Pseudomonas TaxID=196821 RepID=UPI000C7D1486|nr:hypothetical protein [Pseudomonas sp. FFUP_PS_473]MEE3635821.1 hypothetical protein [Pseudomonas sp. AL 58]PLP96095.1 hypothetical protein CYD26_00895 [Pseudomonas sp. FFUP_PS_473]